MPTAELHLGPADGGSKNVHGRKEVVPHLVDAAPDGLQRSDDDVRLALFARASIAPDRFADGAQQDVGRLAAAFHPDRDALLFVGAHQPVDDPGTGRVHLFDGGQVENDGVEALARFDLAHFGIDEGDGTGRPYAREHASQRVAALRHRNLRSVVAIAGRPAACFPFADGQHGRLFTASAATCRFS